MEYMAQKADEQIEGAILEQLRQRIDELEAEKAEREAQEPAAWAWNDALGCMRVHCGPRRPEWVDRECSEATRAEMSLRPLYAATFSDLDAANIEIAKARAEAAKWERLHDELYAEIASEHRRDEYGETETAAECVGRIIRERDQLRAQLDEYERAPTVAKTHGEYGDRIMYLYPFSDKYPPVGTELIARPARKGE